MTNAERQRAYKAKLAEKGLVQCNVLLPAEAVPEFVELAELIRAYPHLRASCARDPTSGKLVGLKTGLRRLHAAQRQQENES